MGWSQSWFDVDVSASICQYDTGSSIISAMVLFCNGLWTSNMVVDPNMGLWNYGFRLPLSRTAFIVYIEDPRVTHPAVRERCGAHQADREPARAASVLPESLRRAIRLRACSAFRRKETMRTFSATTLTGAVLTSLLFSATAFAHEHVALNGTWTLVPAQSDFAGQPVIQTGTVTINERDGDITVSRSFKYEGASDTFFYRDITDSENSATIHTGKELKTKTRWDHDVLKVTNTNTQSGAVTLETYTLAADGTMMVSVVRPGHKLISLRFQRQ
jgi:hypothetical protein